MADAARLPTTPVRPKTLADFLVWEEAQADKHEYRNGQIWMMTGGTLRHTTIAGNIFTALRSKLGNGPCRAYLMNARVALKETEAGYYPDVVVDCGPMSAAPWRRVNQRSPLRSYRLAREHAISRRKCRTTAIRDPCNRSCWSSRTSGNCTSGRARSRVGDKANQGQRA